MTSKLLLMIALLGVAGVARGQAISTPIGIRPGELAEELDDGPNSEDGKVDWSQIIGMPAGFVDGSDDGSGGGSGTMSTVKLNGTAVGDPDIVTLDFLAADFDASESPNTEVNVSIDASITRDAEIDTSAEIAALVGDETGSGALVFGTSPTLTTPNLGTPSAATLTNATGLPVSTGISGLGTGVATMLATPSSANVATAVTDETGSGALVFGTSPTIATPTLNGTPTLGDASGWRTALALVPGTNVQAFDADLSTWAGVTPSANGQSLVAAADYSAMRTLLSLVPGTNVQTQDAFLQDIADLTDPGASRVLKWNDSTNEIEWAVDETAGSGGSGTVNSVKENGTQLGGSDIEVLDFLGADFDLSETPDKEINITIASAIARDSEVSNAIGVLQDAVDGYFGDPATNVNFTASVWRAGLDLEIGTDVQAYDADLDAVAGGITGLVKGLGNGSGYTAATANTDYLAVTGGSPTFVDIDASSGAITASDPFTFAQTWNDGAATFEALRIDVTTTANGGSSRMFAIYDDGNLISYVNHLGAFYAHYWIGLGGGGGNPHDTLIQRQAAHTIAQANGTAAQTFGVAHTYTSATNNELLRLQWASNVGQIGTVKGSGGGTARDLALMTDGTNRMLIGATTGHVTPAADSAQNLGGSGAEWAEVHADTVTTGALAGDAWTALRKKTRTFVLFGPTTDAATGDGKAYYPIPPELNGANITYVHLWAVTAGTTGTSDVQIARVRSGTPADVLSTKVTIDSTEQGSDTAASAAVINTSNDDVATNDVLRIDVDAVSTTPPKGIIVTIGFELQ